MEERDGDQINQKVPLGFVKVVGLTLIPIFLRGFKFEVQQPVVVWCNTSPPRITPHAVT